MSSEWFYIISREKDEQVRDVRSNRDDYNDGGLYCGDDVPIIYKNPGQGGQNVLRENIPKAQQKHSRDK